MKRTITLIPLLPDDEFFRNKAIKYVDRNLQYSIEDLKLGEYNACLDEEVILFFSEVIKCLIASDIRAKTIYYKHDKKWKWNDIKNQHPDDIKYRETDEYSSIDLIDLEMKLFEQRARDMDIRVIDYSILSSEDILRLDYLIDQPPIRFSACLCNPSGEFIGMVYISFEDKIMNVYGIRTTIFGLYKNEKEITKDLFNGLFHYAKKVNIQIIRIVKTPIGPMEDILLSMGFFIQDTRYIKHVETYTAINDVKVIDLGCSFDVLEKNPQLI